MYGEGSRTPSRRTGWRRSGYLGRIGDWQPSAFDKCHSRRGQPQYNLLFLASNARSRGLCIDAFLKGARRSSHVACCVAPHLRRKGIMYKFGTWVVSSVVLILLLPQGGAMARDLSAAPESGTFEAQVDVDSVTGSGCLDKGGYVFVGSMSFPGLSGTTYYLRALETGSNFGVDSLQTLTVTGGKGTTSPTGTFTWTGA